MLLMLHLPIKLGTAMGSYAKNSIISFKRLTRDLPRLLLHPYGFIREGIR